MGFLTLNSLFSVFFFEYFIKSSYQMEFCYRGCSQFNEMLMKSRRMIEYPESDREIKFNSEFDGNPPLNVKENSPSTRGYIELTRRKLKDEPRVKIPSVPIPLRLQYKNSNEISHLDSKSGRNSSNSNYLSLEAEQTLLKLEEHSDQIDRNFNNLEKLIHKAEKFNRNLKKKLETVRPVSFPNSFIDSPRTLAHSTNQLKK